MISGKADGSVSLDLLSRPDFYIDKDGLVNEFGNYEHEPCPVWESVVLPMAEFQDTTALSVRNYAEDGPLAENVVWTCWIGDGGDSSNDYLVGFKAAHEAAALPQALPRRQRDMDFREYDGFVMPQSFDTGYPVGSEGVEPIVVHNTVWDFDPGCLGAGLQGLTQNFAIMSKFAVSDGMVMSADTENCRPMEIFMNDAPASTVGPGVPDPPYVRHYMPDTGAARSNVLSRIDGQPFTLRSMKVGWGETQYPFPYQVTQTDWVVVIAAKTDNTMVRSFFAVDQSTGVVDFGNDLEGVRFMYFDMPLGGQGGDPVPLITFDDIEVEFADECLADTDRSGEQDFMDCALFLNCVEAGVTGADVDRDGDVDHDDMDDYLQAFMNCDCL